MVRNKKNNCRFHFQPGSLSSSIECVQLTHDCPTPAVSPPPYPPGTLMLPLLRLGLSFALTVTEEVILWQRSDKLTEGRSFKVELISPEIVFILNVYLKRILLIPKKY